MKRSVRALAAAMVGAGLTAFAVPDARGAEFCPMGGTQIKAEVVAAKAVEWAKSQDKKVVAEEGTDNWSVLVLSEVDDGIAVLLRKGSVFFGVAGKGGQEVDTGDAERAFGRDLRMLKEAVKKGMGEFWKAGAVKIEGGDVQKLSDAAGLGVLEKERGAWALKTQNCKGVDLDASALK